MEFRDKFTTTAGEKFSFEDVEGKIKSKDKILVSNDAFCIAEQLDKLNKTLERKLKL